MKIYHLKCEYIIMRVELACTHLLHKTFHFIVEPTHPFFIDIDQSDSSAGWSKGDF